MRKKWLDKALILGLLYAIFSMLDGSTKSQPAAAAARPCEQTVIVPK